MIRTLWIVAARKMATDYENILYLLRSIQILIPDSYQENSRNQIVYINISGH